jgi:hypothetical protein
VYIKARPKDWYSIKNSFENESFLDRPFRSNEAAAIWPRVWEIVD